MPRKCHKRVHALFDAPWCCAADPGSMQAMKRVPALRSSASALHRVRDTRDLRRRGLEQPLCGSPRLGGDFRAGQHAGDFLAAVIGGSALTRVATRLPLSSASLEISRCWLARTATCGACVTAITCTLEASRDSRAPIASATAPPTPVSISSNTSVGAEPRSDSTTLSASKSAKLAAGSDLHQRAGSRAGIGLHPELDAVVALRAGRNRIGFNLRGEPRAFELQRREFGVDRLVQFLRRLDPRRGEFRRSQRVTLVGISRRLFQLLQLIGAGIDQRDVGGVFGGERGKPIDRRRIFARGGAQREQPLLDALKLGGIEIGRGERCGRC